MVTVTDQLTAGWKKIIQNCVVVAKNRNKELKHIWRRVVRLRSYSKYLMRTYLPGNTCWTLKNSVYPLSMLERCTLDRSPINHRGSAHTNRQAHSHMQAISSFQFTQPAYLWVVEGQNLNLFNSHCCAWTHYNSAVHWINFLVNWIDHALLCSGQPPAGLQHSDIWFYSVCWSLQLLNVSSMGFLQLLWF